MRCLLLAVVALGAAVPSGAVHGSTAELIEESYRASYPGPASVPEVPEVASKRPEKPTVVDTLKAWYAAEIRKGNEALAKELKKVDASAYTAFLKECKAKALACADKLPEALRMDLVAFLSASDAAEQAALVRKLRKTAEGQPREVFDCLSASMVKLGSRGVLVGGLLWGKTTEGIEQLKPTLHNPGQVYILQPQVLTAWPGRADSALQVLDPRQGPWKVRLAHTYEEEVKTHNQKWKQRLDVKVNDYLKLTNNGHFLLVDGGGAPLGWLDMDQAAFFEERWSESAEESKFIYTSGAAAFVHGV